jgi:hypothetical protein
VLLEDNALGHSAGAEELDRLTAPFGTERVMAELIDHPP